MFGKHTDYHGTRKYAAGRPRAARQPGLRSSLLVAWVKLQIEKVLRAGTPASTSTLLMRGDEKHFTLLGSTTPRERPISDLFPVEAEEERPGSQRRRTR
jgi:hypothetical protein